MDDQRKYLLMTGKSFENNLFRELCSLAKVKELCTSHYHPETNGQCEHFNATLISMLGTLPSHAEKNWQEWITTLTHAYNYTVSPVTGFSPYFLMFGRSLKLPLDIDLGIPTIEQKLTTNYKIMLKSYILNYNGHTKKLRKATGKNQNVIKSIMIRG